MTGRVGAVALGAGMLLLAACGGSPASGSGSSGANPLKAMSLRADDVPAGLHLCSQSGDMTKILSVSKATNLSTWDSIRSTWAALQHDGATDGWWQLYATSQTECNTYFAQGGYSRRGMAFSQEMPLVTMMMISTITQFRDSQSALRSVINANGRFLGGGFGPDAYAPPRPWYPDGPKLGVSSDSVFWTSKPGSGETPSLQGGWVNKSFLFSVSTFNIPLPDAEKAVSKMNARVP